MSSRIARATHRETLFSKTKIGKMELWKFKIFQHFIYFQKSHKINVKRKEFKISLIKLCLHRWKNPVYEYSMKGPLRTHHNNYLQVPRTKIFQRAKGIFKRMRIIFRFFSVTKGAKTQRKMSFHFWEIVFNLEFHI